MSGKRAEDADSPRGRRSWQEPITVEPPGFVEMTEEQRRAAVAAFADILATWWQRRADTATTEPPAQ